MNSYRAVVSIFYSGGKRKAGNLPLESSATETFCVASNDEAREAFFSLIEKYLKKEGHEEDVCFRATLHCGDQLVHELDACSPQKMLKELTPERRSEMKKLHALWEEHRKRNKPQSPMASKMQSGGA